MWLLKGTRNQKFLPSLSLSSLQRVRAGSGGAVVLHEDRVGHGRRRVHVAGPLPEFWDAALACRRLKLPGGGWGVSASKELKNNEVERSIEN